MQGISVCWLSLEVWGSDTGPVDDARAEAAAFLPPAPRPRTSVCIRHQVVRHQVVRHLGARAARKEEDPSAEAAMLTGRRHAAHAVPG